MNNILKGTPLPAANGRIAHEHYKYRIKFNNISKINQMSLCNKGDGMQQRVRQCDKQYWKDNLGTEYLAFVAETHCCTIETVTETEQASHAIAARHFPVIVALSELHIGITAPRRDYIGEDLLHLFDSRLAMVQPLLSDFRKMRDKVCEFMTAEDSSTANVAAHSLLSIINTAQDQVENNFLTVDKEVQFNNWLFTRLDALLSPKGFIVRENKVNKDIIPNVCEYSTSQPDCVVYHMNSVLRSRVSAVTVQVEDNRSESEDFCVNVAEAHDFMLTSSMGVQ